MGKDRVDTGGASLQVNSRNVDRELSPGPRDGTLPMWGCTQPYPLLRPRIFPWVPASVPTRDWPGRVSPGVCRCAVPPNGPSAPTTLAIGGRGAGGGQTAPKPCPLPKPQPAWRTLCRELAQPGGAAKPLCRRGFPVSLLLIAPAGPARGPHGCTATRMRLLLR